MKLGINTVVLGESTLEEALQHVAWAGYSYVELAAIKGMREHVTTDSEAGEVQELLEKYQLKATAMEAATNDKERLEALMKKASEIGIGIINIGSGGKTDDKESTEAAISLMRDFAKMAADNNITLAVKPHVGQAIYNCETGVRLLDEVTEGNIGLNFDPSHLARADENPAEVAHTWKGKIVTSHFRDCPVRVPGPPGTPEQQVPGRGALDLSDILKALKETGYAGPINLEIIGAKEWPLSRAMGLAAEARGYLHRCFEELGITDGVAA